VAADPLVPSRSSRDASSLADTTMPSAIHVPHPDNRPYPWLATRRDEDGDQPAAGNERFLIYQPFAGMCNQFSCLECCVAIARILGRTLVLPRWRPQYGYPWLKNSDAYFEVGGLASLVNCIDLEEFARRRAGKPAGEGVVLCRTHLEYNATWSDPKGFELYPALKSLLHDLEYMHLVDAESQLRLGFSPSSREGGAAAAAAAAGEELRVSLARPLRGEREVRATWGDVGAEVLALDHAFNVVALPSVLDAGQRAMLQDALRPCARLRARLDGFLGGVARPCLAAHVRRTDHWRLAQLLNDGRFWPRLDDFVHQIGATVAQRRLSAWLLSTDCDAADELARLRAVPRLAASEALTDGEDAVAVAVLHMWMCASADFFVGTRGSMYSDFIERFRVADGRVVDHAFFEPAAAAAAAPTAPAAPAAAATAAADAAAAAATAAADAAAAAADADATADATAPPTAAAAAAAAAASEPQAATGATTAEPTLDEVLTRREKAIAVEVPAERLRTLQLAAAGGEARGGAILGLMCQRLPPELRAKVLSYHPDAAAMPATVCRTPIELFDDFLAASIDALRARPLRVAPPGSTPNVALLIEPRCHANLEYVIRNAAWFLGPSWQLQVFHGTTNEAHIRAAFSAAELEHVQFVSLEVDNLTPLAHNELMCTHWLWSRAAAERVLIFQTDSLICRDGVDAFQKWDYIGAPWRTTDLWCVGKPWLTGVGGNGGFSLRSRARTLRCLDAAGYVRGQCEDVFYAEHMPKVGGALAPRADGLRFSVESVYAPRPFGLHAAYKWISSEEMQELLGTIVYSS